MTSQQDARTDELVRKNFMIGKAFSPAAPIKDRDLFAGRIPQMATVASVTSQAGQHALIYGERGVGKTSLARVTASILSTSEVVAPYYVCSSDDTFATIWSGLLEDVKMVSLRNPVGFGGPPESLITNAAQLLSMEQLSPHRVAQALSLLTERGSLVAFIDEFDRPVDANFRRLVADTAKILADLAVSATLVLVGVADTVKELIGEHASIQRSLIQVQMPRMADEEMREIIRRGMTAAEMSADPGFASEVVELSQGLPHYAHLLGLHGAKRAAGDARDRVLKKDFDEALALALEDSSQTVREDYHRATFSNRETLYGHVLLACALTRKDDLGLFGAPDVRDQLQRITGKAYDIPAFASHLNDFSSTDGPRGGILQRRGTTRRFRYRFRDPLMPPYVVMRGKKDGIA